MGNIMVRMGVVIGVLVAVQAGFGLVGRLGHPAVIEPQRPINDFPTIINTPQAGKWEGKDAKLDERSFNNSEVDEAVSRIYTKDGQNLKFFLAEYKQPAKGLYHSPMNCYHSQGFTLIGDVEFLPLTARDRPDTQISITTWQRNSEKIIVAYWYELGDRTMFERQDLLKTQWAMFGKSKWPVMFKVLLEMPAGDSEQPKTEIVNVAQSVREWLGEIKPVVE